MRSRNEGRMVALTNLCGANQMFARIFGQVEERRDQFAVGRIYISGEAR